MSNIVIFPCIGYFLENRINIEEIGKKIPIMWIVNILLIFIQCYMTYYRGNIMGYYLEHSSQVFHNNYQLINGIVIFLTVKYLYIKYKDKFNVSLTKLILSIGESVFGIFLIHLLIRDTRVFKKLLSIIMDFKINPLISIWIFIFTLMITCYIIVYILRKIPIVKKVL